jgi:hypothetical protein
MQFHIQLAVILVSLCLSQSLFLPVLPVTPVTCFQYTVHDTFHITRKYTTDFTTVQQQPTDHRVTHYLKQPTRRHSTYNVTMATMTQQPTTQTEQEQEPFAPRPRRPQPEQHFIGDPGEQGLPGTEGPSQRSGGSGNYAQHSRSD